MTIKKTYYKGHAGYYFELIEYSTGAECSVYGKDCRCKEFLKGADKNEINDTLLDCFTFGGLYDDEIIESVHSYTELMDFIKADQRS